MQTRTFALIAAALALPAGTPASAALANPGAPQKDTTVGDVVTQPLSDVNVKKKDIPPLLTRVLEDPYSLDGLKKCAQVAAAVDELNGVLGPDFDMPDPEDKDQKRRNGRMGVAGNVLNSFIPFRWVIREVSGANKADDEYRIAVYAGSVRRGFLKGYGRARGCKPPAAPAPLPPPEPEAEPRKN